MCIRRDHCDRCPGIPCPHRAKSCLPSHSWLPTAPTGGRASSDCTVRNPIPPLRSRRRISGRCYIFRPLQRCGQHWCRRRDCACRPESPDRHQRGIHRDNMARSSSMDEEEERCRYVPSVTKFAILPSLSQVMSCKVALRVGRSFRRWIGMIGKSWSIAQLSGRLWNREKLQKYLSARILSNPLSSSGTCFMCLARLLISWHTLQYIASISARVFRSTMP